MRLRNILALGLPAASLLVCLTPAPSSAAVPPVTTRIAPRTTPSTVTLSAGGNVTVDKNSAWILTIQYTSDSPANIYGVGLTLGNSKGGTGAEVHGWSFALASKSGLTFNTSTGATTLNTTSTYSPVSTADVAFTAISKKPASCSKGSEIIYAGKLSGKVTLDTGLKPAGNITVSTFTAKGTTPTVTADFGCVPPVANDCLASIEAASTSSASGVRGAVIDGTVFGASVDDVSVFEETPLTSPKGASRTDAALLDKPTVTWTASKKTLAITASSSGEITGAATISGGKVTSEKPFTCTFDGKKYTDTIVDASGATWASSAGKELVGKMTLTPTLTATTKSTTASYEVETD
jgi:hypothetical protein